MTYEKNDKVHVKTESGDLSGTILDRYIQETELELSGETLVAKATEENPVYLVELSNGDKKMINESSISIGSPH